MVFFKNQIQTPLRFLRIIGIRLSFKLFWIYPAEGGCQKSFHEIRPYRELILVPKNVLLSMDWGDPENNARFGGGFLPLSTLLLWLSGTSKIHVLGVLE